MRRLAQYTARTGTTGPVSRSHVETATIDGQEHAVKLGVFLANSKTRRARLTTDQLQQLAALGLDWAKTTQTQTETETAETVPPAFCSGTAWSCC